jgi:hypothetical protein
VILPLMRKTGPAYVGLDTVTVEKDDAFHGNSTG